MGKDFEWDNEKAKQNLTKHGVPFDEASTVFGDFLSLTIPDPLHSAEENRFVTLGMSYRQRCRCAYRKRGKNKDYQCAACDRR